MKKKPNYEILFFLWKRRKNLLTMKLLLCFILFSMLNVSGSIFSQSATFDLAVNGKTVREVFKDIESQSQYRFLYNDDFAGLHHVVSFNTKDNNINEVLGELLAGANLSYRELENELIVITPLSYENQENIVSGKVIDSSLEPIPGVTVSLKGTTRGMSTDIDGFFTLSNVPSDAILVFSFVGMLTKEVNINNQTSINVTMEYDAIGIDEVVAIGYGVERRGSITGAISSVSARDIQEVPVADAASALQGRVPGVLALSAGSRPGDGVTIRIRGRRSLSATNNPLFVVDGIPYEGNINDINPRDIRSMEILKDASATAIYGSRGANGVILISTTRGGNIPTVVSYNAYYGITSALGTPAMMNSEEYVRMRTVGGRTFNAAEMSAIEQGIDVDWYDIVVGNGYKQDHQLSIRGGSENTGFFLSASLFDEKALIENQDFLRKSLRLNLDHEASDRFRVGTSLSVSDQFTNYGSNLFFQAINLMPLAEPYDSEGNLVYQPGADPLRWNPLADLIPGAYVDERSRLRIFANIFGEIDISDNLNYRMNFGPDYQKYDRGQFRGSLSSARRFGEPDALIDVRSTYTYTFENILNYNTEIRENHALQFTGLFSMQESESTRANISARGFPYEHQLFHNIGTSESITAIGSDLTEWGIMSFMARINYSIKETYLFTFTSRYDGSSRLAEDYKWGYFPSAAFLWRISNEGFMDNQNIFSDLRFRVSYGITGNTVISPYQTRGALTRTIYNFGGVAGYGYRPGAISNPLLSWESSATANIGIDFGIGETIAGALEIYQTNTRDLLLQRFIPITSGFSSVMENIGETRNRGFDFNISSRIISTSDFSWNANLNIFGNREAIIDLYGDKEDDIGNQWFIGEPLTVFYDYEKIGIWQLNEADEAASYQMQPGEIKVADVNEDGMITHEDRTILGTDIPFATVGLGSQLRYRNFDFSLFLFSSFGHTIFNQFEVQQSTLQGRYNNLKVDYWTEDNPTNAHPKPDAGRENPLYGSTRGYQKGDFLKVRNIQIGYTLPQNLLARIGAQRMKIYVNAENPLIFSHLAANLDPESYGGTVSRDTPSYRMFSLGVNIDF